jgi:pimeloyl-ACP methyl ester carboxylesterase
MTKFSDYIKPMSVQGLQGRVLVMPPNDPKNKNNQIMMLYGLHSSIERMQGIIENIADAGTVTVPDIPGFGGMESLYSKGIKPTSEALAENLYEFVKQHYGDTKFKVVAMSYGFVVVTRMLQKYPELNDQITLVVSLAGLTDRREFIVSKANYFLWISILNTFNGRFRAKIFKHVFLSPLILKSIYKLQAARHPKFKDADKVELNKRLDYEVHLWQINDQHTYMLATKDVLQLSTPKSAIPVKLLHVSIDSDQYVDHKLVLSNLKNIYKDVDSVEAHMPNHAPTVISSKEDAAPYVPPKVLEMLTINR